MHAAASLVCASLKVSKLKMSTAVDGNWLLQCAAYLFKSIIYRVFWGWPLPVSNRANHDRHIVVVFCCMVNSRRFTGLGNMIILDNYPICDIDTHTFIALATDTTALAVDRLLL